MDALLALTPLILVLLYVAFDGKPVDNQEIRDLREKLHSLQDQIDSWSKPKDE